MLSSGGEGGPVVGNGLSNRHRAPKVNKPKVTRKEQENHKIKETRTWKRVVTGCVKHVREFLADVKVEGGVFGNANCPGPFLE